MAFLWQELFPTNCPPLLAAPASGTHYFLVPKLPVTNEDFKPLAISQPIRFAAFNEAEEQCRACGLSIWNSREAIQTLQKRVKGFKNFKTAKGELGPELGRTLQTSPNPAHFTFWVYEKTDLPCLFQVLD